MSSMTGVEAEKELHKAALEGDLAKSVQLLQGHPWLFNVVSFACSRNLLHIATLAGKADIVEEVLKIKPELARNLDSQKSSPLHIAAAQGSVAIAQKLLAKAPEMLWCRDGQGMNPVHIAAMRGEKDFLQEIIGDNTLPAAMERLSRGQTVLHLCVKHRQLEALKVLVEKLGHLIAQARDKDGDTILDSAVRSNQINIITYLVKETKINKLSMNSMKKTARKILKESPPNPTTGSEIRELLRGRTVYAFLSSAEIRERSSALMVVVVLIATMAFQAAVSPPGGVWQEDNNNNNNPPSLFPRAGNSVMAFTHPRVYKLFLVSNTGSFVLSLLTILMLITGFPSARVSVGQLVTLAVALAEVSILVSYGACLVVITPSMETRFLRLVGVMAFIMFVIYMSLFDILAILSSFWAARR